MVAGGWLQVASEKWLHGLVGVGTAVVILSFR